MEIGLARLARLARRIVIMSCISVQRTEIITGGVQGTYVLPADLLAVLTHLSPSGQRAREQVDKIK